MHSEDLVFLCFLCITYASKQNEYLNHFDGCALRSGARDSANVHVAVTVTMFARDHAQI